MQVNTTRTLYFRLTQWLPWGAEARIDEHWELPTIAVFDFADHAVGFIGHPVETFQRTRDATNDHIV